MGSYLVADLDSDNDGSKLKEGLWKVSQKLLQRVHVEAMTIMGATLSNKTWQLMPMDVMSLSHSSSSPPFHRANNGADAGAVASNPADSSSRDPINEQARAIRLSLEWLLEESMPFLSCNP